MERFVRLVVAGGIALVVGLWGSHALAWPAAALGALVALCGLCALGAGIASEIER
ncbi:hypothetical protein MBEHAL_0521 [Halarchaeum acidiphilum MH1-52-1]|uniref:Uncharacterized protein n=1 Tax=Halarchaeum acidiphilum MH1-52-1 TaxID=1261545 RepID=U2YDK4_9EURY|nr:hypothetical protein [Halarchaeum acidiphilum]GAD51761.1 hypothetical protein MBEHAL_0521 [Halarchaeum acidiphilum MH1-52-1]